MGRFTLQFKEEAVALAQQPGASVRSVARSLGIGSRTLQYWIEHPPGTTRRAVQTLGEAEANDPVALKLRLKEAEARIRRLEIERDILKKATAYFASQNQ
jgi:transposase-like protein